MTREQQIEEMAEIVKKHSCKSCDKYCKYYGRGMECEHLHNMETLYNAGYRKREEIEKQVAKTKTRTNLEFLKNMCPFGFMQIIFDKITEFERITLSRI